MGSFNKLNAPTALAIIVLVILGGAALGTWTIPYLQNNSPQQNTIPDNPYQPVQPTPVAGSTYTGALFFEVVNPILGTGITTATTTVDVIAADANGNFNVISPAALDTKSQAANPQAMSSIWKEGTRLLLEIDCTGNPSGGLDYYPNTLVVTLADGATIYEVNKKSNYQLTSESPVTYAVSGGVPVGTVTKYVSNYVYYWNLGKLPIYPRQAAADVDIYLKSPASTLASVTDASTWVDTDAEITANYTLASTSDTLTFSMVGATASLGWGRSFVAFDSLGYVHQYGAVITIATGMNTMTTPSQWNVMSIPTLTAEKVMYKDISDISGSMPAKGQKPTWSISIPIDSSAATAATEYKFSAWINDCVNLDNIVNGPNSAVPTAYGFVTSYGVGAIVHTPVITASSSISATQQLMTYLTTPS